MSIQLLPYIEPAKSITANHRSNNLEQHLIAFLAINNKSGFLIEKFNEDCVVGSVINTLMKCDHLTFEQFNDYLIKFKELIPFFNRDQLGRLIARCLGYHSEDSLWRFYNNSRQEYKELIVNSRTRIKIQRSKTINRNEDLGGTITAFRKAVIINGRVTHAELDLVNPAYRDLIKKCLVSKKISIDEVKRSLKEIRRTVPETKQDKHTQTLDALYLCLGYVTDYSARTAFRKHGYLENLRFDEHVKCFSSKT